MGEPRSCERYKVTSFQRRDDTQHLLLPAGPSLGEPRGPARPKEGYFFFVVFLVVFLAVFLAAFFAMRCHLLSIMQIYASAKSTSMFFCHCARESFGAIGARRRSIAREDVD